MIRLHGYWRSTAAYRVRIALALKGLPFEQVTHDLRTGAQREAAYAALNPQRLVPALESEDGVLTQSLAIVEWLDETHPAPPLLPPDPAGRAVVRAMAAIVASDIHPLNNLRVLQALRTDFAASETQVAAWMGRWIGDGFAALEALVQRHGGAYAYGDQPGLADVALVPQLYAARRFAIDLTPFPALVAAGAAAEAVAAIAGAAPDRQPDAA